MALTLDDTQTAALLDALGLPADTDDANLVVDTAKDLATQVQGLDTAKASAVVAAAARHGMEVIDKPTADALRRDAQEGRRVIAAAAKAKVEAAVDHAIDTGRIMASSKKHWITLCENDETMLPHLASIAPGTAVPLSEVGHSADATPDPNPSGQWFY
ncbi:hypothetical protein MKUB_29180 [Mycobacterium kubicae]|uniref:Mu-like prophage I protein n=1 Tax=Mycobacterium kubicae TaxID=120959 RepID=A0AAP9UVM8_9MYCO|nr:phage protease [Mycobacterium kubicae]MCV7097797.1 hypothetical protein [Mycobacterium kubicae]ORW03310.1 hypothetical protein AWC13_02480 [Mycobacterium kubicae]QNI10201.1 hypothetical protein GAN18_02275 [Mycobacterium kubicae]QNI11687.1 hypothetical protein GAN18_11100 [Mycobacterium kubicae]QNI12380.1 hypothetical protein GAN18_15195 [Mycobacterium kubicae]